MASEAELRTPRWPGQDEIFFVFTPRWPGQDEIFFVFTARRVFSARSDPCFHGPASSRRWRREDASEGTSAAAGEEGRKDSLCFLARRVFLAPSAFFLGSVSAAMAPGGREWVTTAAEIRASESGAPPPPAGSGEGGWRPHACRGKVVRAGEDEGRAPRILLVCFGSVDGRARGGPALYRRRSSRGHAMTLSSSPQRKKGTCWRCCFFWRSLWVSGPIF
jgi:hypothetical protein